MKLIIYALGQVFERCKNEINWDEVIAVADKKVRVIESMAIAGREYPMIDPAAISHMEYDYIAVFSDIYFEKIKMELSGEYFIPQEKIIPYKEVVGEQDRLEMKFLDFCRAFCREKKCRNVLDFGMSVLPRYYLTLEELFPEQETEMDGLSYGTTDFNVNLYRNLYQNLSDSDKDYDMVLVWRNPDELVSEIESVYKKGRYILFSTSYLFHGKSVRKLLDKALAGVGQVSCISCAEGLLWTIDTRAETKINADGKGLSIYVVTHKKYNCLSDDLYKPLCVGDYRQSGCLSEQTGDTIARLNEKINECTALYWIWKNTKEEIVGLNHYRRYFYNNEIVSSDNYLDTAHILEILENYDIILTEAYSVPQVYRRLVETVDPALLEKSYQIIRNLIKKEQPDYLESFDAVMEGSSIFTCNMFVTRRDILDRYCEWLFSFLIEAAEKTAVEGYDAYSRRVVGFFAERMWTVWLRKNRLRIKELPSVVGW